MNLACGPGESDLALHLNPRPGGVNEVVRNSFINEEWGEEERDGPDFPLVQGEQFVCAIAITDECYEVLCYLKIEWLKFF